MADAGVAVVLSKLHEVASAEVTALLKVDNQIRELWRGLGYLQAEIRGADQQRRGRASELLLLWARETREVTFDVEDAVDEFHLKVEAAQVKAKWGRTWYSAAVKLLDGLVMQIFVRHGLSRDIKRINERIKEINQIKETYEIQSTPSELWSLSPTDADVVWDIESGSTEFREKEFEKLKEQILNTGPNKLTHRAIISILGASGTGKTRLARKLYSDHEINKNFEVLAWICLPPRIRFEQYVDMIFEQIRPQVKKEHGQGGSGDATDALSSQASEKLKEILKGSRYLVVLDGLVDTGNWNSLLNLLPEDNTKSRILITTQLNAKEIKHADPKMKPTVLNHLDIIQTAELILEQVSGADGLPPWQFSDEDYSTRHFPQRVHSITRGLPLAVVVLGGILRTKEYPSEWTEVFSQKLETSMGEPKAIRYLWLLAFEELPNHLKSCFLYLATASETILLGPDRLVRLWIAEGFVAPRKGQTLEEVGLGYLKELICRGLVELVEKDARGGIKKVTVHSLLHSFVQAEAQESSFVEIHHQASVLNPHAVRRLAIHNFVDSYVDIPDRFPKLRSLLCDFLEEEQDNGGRRTSVHHVPQSRSQWPLGNPAEWLLRVCGGSVDGPPADTKKLHPLSIIRGSRFLRVIDLYGLLLASVPDEIGSIIHLRYLGIRNCKLSELPASISKLDNLQTLDVRKTKVNSITHELWELRGLRHVLADALRLPNKCPSTHLKQLQTLVGVKPPDAWSSNGCCPLNHMIYLRSLTLCSIPGSTDIVHALLSALQKMEFLASLSLCGNLLPSGVFTNPSSRRLEALELHGRLDSPPSGPFILPNLGKLTLLESGNLTQDFVDKVAALPNLAEMELLDGSYSAAQLVFVEGGFPSLTKLKLKNLAELERLELAPRSVPELAVMTHCGCTNMTICDNRRTPHTEGENNEGDTDDVKLPCESDTEVLTQREVRQSLSSTRMAKIFSGWEFPVVDGTNGRGTRDLTDKDQDLRESTTTISSDLIVNRRELPEPTAMVRSSLQRRKGRLE
uniref:AAA+ ATPase domain-containing protein n=1 Tax=Arundo donax TaxID=35708 RepID=A0A0A9FSA8_ARUDO